MAVTPGVAGQIARSIASMLATDYWSELGAWTQDYRVGRDVAISRKIAELYPNTPGLNARQTIGIYRDVRQGQLVADTMRANPAAVLPSSQLAPDRQLTYRPDLYRYEIGVTIRSNDGYERRSNIEVLSNQPLSRNTAVTLAEMQARIELPQSAENASGGRLTPGNYTVDGEIISAGKKPGT